MAANPTSESELHLYRVLQRSNLLQYFETFISQGGDDVQQLCEAGEEEFLEIMALVGMASKPLHVRRLQKSLQEWVTNPAVFHQPLGPHTPPPPVAPGSILASVQRPYLKMSQSSTPLPITNTSMANWSPPETAVDLLGTAQLAAVRSFSPVSVAGTEGGIYSDSIVNANGIIGGLAQQLAYNVDSPEYGGANSMVDDRSTISPGPTMQLTDGQIAAIEKAAEELAKTLPHYEPKPLNAKKLINKEIEEVIKLPNDHPERMDLLRKYGCIYGRFDSRRKNDKHLSLHEVSVNEASAQLCKHRSTLLTRRDDLFPLARQVVRDSGYQYSKGHSSRRKGKSERHLNRNGSKLNLPKPEDLTRQVLLANIREICHRNSQRNAPKPPTTWGGISLESGRGQTVEIPPNKKQRFENFMYPKQEPFLGSPHGFYRRKQPQKSLEDRSERMSDINRELTTITAHQQALKHQIQQTTGADSEEVTPAHGELQKLRERQLLLLMEQSDLLRKQRSLKRSQFQQAVDKGLKEEGQEEYDEDSMPFPTETFPQNATEEDFFDVSPAKVPKEYVQQSLYQEGLRMIQQYTGNVVGANFGTQLQLPPAQLPQQQQQSQHSQQPQQQQGTQVNIKQEVVERDMELETSESGSSPETGPGQGTMARPGTWQPRPGTSGGLGNRAFDQHTGHCSRTEGGIVDDAVEYGQADGVNAGDNSGFRNAESCKAGDNGGKRDTEFNEADGSYVCNTGFSLTDGTQKETGQS